MDRSEKMLILISFFFLSVGSNLNLVDAGCGPDNCQPADDGFYGPQSPVVVVSDADFQCKVEQSPQVVMCQFYAVWCPPCKNLKPEWEKAAVATQGKVTFAAIDVDKSPCTKGKYGIRRFPTMKVFVPGKEPQDYNGARDAKSLETFALEQANIANTERGDCCPK
ncbi:hypothetical protein L2E82_46961 [Cichorium intybus]|uniref:Uncharacterized protein n=2 Tax=Cichorium intybus TaxID=13427 RepID=A0ACB8YU28_CICIN|nr:hypothetical protein L2E82_46960 [Cichorium intybus]KAI3689013.1 hypothetical protein L2E82_46961 [Cichorium intybus]